jgi:hypothetical protein
MWQEYGCPCVDAMVYYQEIDEKSLVEIVKSDTVGEFYNFSYYNELMKRNINPVVLDNLEARDELKCLPPDVVK